MQLIVGHPSVDDGQHKHFGAHEMIQATTKSAFFTTLPNLPLRGQPGTRVVAKPVASSLSIPAAMKDRSRVKDAMSLVLLGVLAISVLACTACTAWMAREFIDVLLSFSNVGIMRGFAGV